MFVVHKKIWQQQENNTMKKIQTSKSHDLPLNQVGNWIASIFYLKNIFTLRVPLPDGFKNMCTLNQISMFLLLYQVDTFTGGLLATEIIKWPVVSVLVLTWFISYIYWNSQFSNIVIIITTNVLLPQQGPGWLNELGSWIT